ncbi:MAG: hypothetical protein ACK5JT_14640, partial [Hyphomicrobiaceae bacterium]
FDAAGRPEQRHTSLDHHGDCPFVMPSTVFLVSLPEIPPASAHHFVWDATKSRSFGARPVSHAWRARAPPRCATLFA